MRIYIITDIEGVSGAVWGGFGLPTSGEVPFNTEVMTAEINTVVRTLMAEGIRDITLHEAHKFQPGVLPESVKIVHGAMMTEKYDALFFVGQHGPAGDPQSVIAHSFNSACNYKMTLNGLWTGELTYMAAVAGALGTPTVFASGDHQVLLEARRNLRAPIEFVRDEYGLSNHSAICRPFRAIERELKTKTRRALDRIAKTPPFDLGRIEMRIAHRYHGMSEKARRFPFVRWEGNALAIQAADMLEADRLRRQIILARDFWSLAYADRYHPAL